MLTCDEVHEQLGRWYDGELGEHQARPIAEHVAACRGCSAEVESWRRLDQMLAIEVDAGDLEAAVLAALPATATAATTGWWLKLAAAVVVSAGLGGLGGWAASLGDQRPHRDQELTSLTLLEQSFAPGSLEGIDALADDQTRTRGGR